MSTEAYVKEIEKLEEKMEKMRKQIGELKKHNQEIKKADENKTEKMKEMLTKMNDITKENLLLEEKIGGLMQINQMLEEDSDVICKQCKGKEQPQDRHWKTDQCRYGDHCRRQKCRFKHPKDKESNKEKSRDHGYDKKTEWK